MAGTLYQYYNTGDDYNEPTYYYDGLLTYTSLFMTFRTTVAHKLSSVKLKLWREGSRTGSVYVYLYSAHSSTSVPDSKLATANTMPFNDISTDPSGTWYEFTFSTPYQLFAYTQYNIVIYNGALDSSSNKINWRSDSTNPTYANGTGGWGHSSNTEFSKVPRDFMFEEYGVTTNTSTVSMSALLKGINTKTVSIDTRLKDIDSKTVSLDTYIEGTSTKTVELYTFLKDIGATTVDIDTFLKGFPTKTVDVNTLLKYIGDTTTVSLDVLLGSMFSDIFIDILLRDSDSTSVDITALLEERISVELLVDSYIQATDTKTPLIDVILKGSGLKQTTIDVLLLLRSLNQVYLDVLMSGEGSACLSLDMLIGDKIDFRPTAKNSISTTDNATNSSA